MVSYNVIKVAVPGTTVYYVINAKTGPRHFIKTDGVWQINYGKPLDYKIVKQIGEAIERSDNNFTFE